jgi:hypothetical protein
MAQRAEAALDSSGNQHARLRSMRRGPLRAPVSLPSQRAPSVQRRCLDPFQGKDGGLNLCRSLVAITPGPARNGRSGLPVQFWNRFLPPGDPRRGRVTYVFCTTVAHVLSRSPNRIANRHFVRRLRQTPRPGGLISANNNSCPIAPIFLPAAAKRCPGSPTALNLPAIHRINPQRHPDSDFHRISPRGMQDPGYEVVVPAAR